MDINDQQIISKRARIILDNDFGGDPDGLFQLAHHLLSPSMEVVGIIGSHHHKQGFYGYPGSAAYSTKMVHDLLSQMKLPRKTPVFKGAEEYITDSGGGVRSEGVDFIVQEALRTDSELPLYLACGAGLTDVASAYLSEPGIAKRLRLLWIGGPEYKGHASPPPGGSPIEYNLSIDRKACQIIFNQSEIPLWQIPRNTYRQALVSYGELKARMGKKSSVTRFLLGRLQDLMLQAGGSLGEAYVLGDSPLVLLTALQSSWEVDPSSCRYVEMKAPLITDDGVYQDNPNGRLIRVYTDIDVRLMMEDFYAKMATTT